MTFQKWFDTFLEEKGLDQVYQQWEIPDSQGTAHFIDNEVVVDLVKQSAPREQAQIKSMLVRIDFANAPVMPFFKHLAESFIKAHYG